MDFSLPRPFAPGSKSSGVELSLPGTFAPWNFRSLELSFPPINTARSESSNKCVDLHVRIVQNFYCHVTVKLARSAPKTICTQEQKNFHSLELSLLGTFVPPMNTARSESSNKCVDLHVQNFCCHITSP